MIRFLDAWRHTDIFHTISQIHFFNLYFFNIIFVLVFLRKWKCNIESRSTDKRQPDALTEALDTNIATFFESLIYEFEIQMSKPNLQISAKRNGQSKRTDLTNKNLQEVNKILYKS